MGSTMASPIEYNIPRWTAEAALRLLPETPWPRSRGSEKTWFTPDDVLLVAEVVSPGNAVMDRKVKPDLYADSGIEYFLRVELAALRSTELFGLTGGGYTSIATAGPGQRLVTDRPFTLTLNPADLRVS